MKHAKKRPHTLKERIRSKLWDFLMEDPPETLLNHQIKIDFDSKAFAKVTAHDLNGKE